MFLHETGEDNDTFSRQDLSSMNAVSTQRPTVSSTASPSKPSHHPPPPQQQPPSQNVPAAKQHSVNRMTKDEAMSRSDSDDGSALPTTASWAKNPQIQQSRRSSQAAIRSTPSPKTTYASINHQISDSIPPPVAEASATTETAVEDSSKGKAPEPIISKTTSEPPPIEESDDLPPIPLERAVQEVMDSSFEWSLDRSLHDEETLSLVDNYPPLIDSNGGAIRYALKLEEDRERLKQEEEERNTLQAISAAEDDDNLASGSLQLGGEPEPQENQMDSTGQIGHGQRNHLQQRNFAGSRQSFDGQSSLANDFSNLSFNGRSLTPQQQQQLLSLNSSNQHEPMFDQFQKGISGGVSQHQPSLSNPFQAQNQHLSLLSGHNRHASRYTFANDTTSASAAVKPATNAQVMAQQSAMMPSNSAKSYTQPQQAPSMHTNFYSGVQGPPPGLKSSGTPPISGGGMFGQGHGFASAMGGAIGFGNGNSGMKNNNNNKEDLMRELLRGRNSVGNGLGSDTGKREFFPSFLQKPTTSTTTPAPGLLSSLYGTQLGAYNGYNDPGPSKQKKKGKKHRHANTSSSGGGGIVDLADPSILQARMHHGGIGQGPYGGTQGQGGYSSSSMMYRGGFGNGW